MNAVGTDPTPLYARLEAELTANIVDRTFPPGSQLPTEDELIIRFEVSRTTVRKAIQNLASRRLIEIRRGKGTFVAEPKITHELTELSGFVEEMQAAGHHPTARLVDTAIIAADDTVSRQLGIATGTLVVRIQRVRLADGVALSFDETYLPRPLGEQIISNDLEVEPIFSLLEQKYHVALREAEYRLEAVSATEAVAQALGVDPGSPMFRIERTSYTDGNLPVDYETLSYRGDLIRFVTRLNRRPADRA